MTPRRRRAGNRDLPPNLYRNKNKGTFIYRNPNTGKRHGMGSNKQKAVAAARKLNAILIKHVNLVDKVIGAGSTLAEFISYYAEEVLPERELAKATLGLYDVRIRQITAVLGAHLVDEVTVMQVADFLDTLTARSANQARALLVDIFNHAIAKGHCGENPAAITIPRKEKKMRKRHTAEGVKAIYGAAESWLRNAIDLALITAQRREEIVLMRFSDIKDDGLYVVQQKTRRQSDAGWIKFSLTPQLQEVLARCRDDVPSPFLVHRKPVRIPSKKQMGDRHWTQVTCDYLTKAFRAARDKSGAYDHLEPNERPTFHELRAYSLHLYKKTGRDAQTIAGHARAEMTKNYQADHDEIVWSEAVADLDLSGVTR